MTGIPVLRIAGSRYCKPYSALPIFFSSICYLPPVFQVKLFVYSYLQPFVLALRELLRYSLCIANVNCCSACKYSYASLERPSIQRCFHFAPTKIWTETSRCTVFRFIDSTAIPVQTVALYRGFWVRIQCYNKKVAVEQFGVALKL
jgi:hypothetical protein